MSTEAGVGVMGTKLGMMSFFETDNKVVPVTIVGFKEGDRVTQVKTSATDDYDAVQFQVGQIVKFIKWVLHAWKKHFPDSL
ncbi:hypothetical protein HRI_000935500 [Hibiscus trionum]|uniref:50S ribosomal protein L3 n=1 Tax=Hibiscus trionum TaxID=183268 RepID=A0A9W7LPR8_HIBTR|nr:hypothetical protein HRI_000935500 [Hibiscus trionum]